jgi:D-alanyl-D-alanine carboxypeptidase (penicillin-binding protein 5/6)
MMKLKHWVWLVCLLFMVQPAAAAPAITAHNAIVMDVTTGRILYEKNAHQRAYPASTTKITTLITALEESDIHDKILVSDAAAATEGSSLDLKAGETLNELDMLYGMMLVSGNDAAVAIAEHISGSQADFAKLMTEKAHLWGALDTRFANPNGLPDPNHYTTAYDLAVITVHGYTNPWFRRIIQTRTYSIPGHEVENTNKLLSQYSGANGVKTGWTDSAGRCLVAGAKRNNVQLVAVILNSEDIWGEAAALLDAGFAQLEVQ